MMQSREKFESGQLTEMALRMHEDLRSAGSRREALDLVSLRASRKLGTCLSAQVLAEPDEVLISFLEVLDQIVFEVGEEQDSRDGHAAEYIVDDLYQRLEVYLDLFRGLNFYRKNLPTRILNREDTVIIRHRRLAEYVPFLISEFFEQPHMRKPIMQALIYFSNEELLNFFYEIARNEYDLEMKILALLGLKNNQSVFYNWNMLKGQGDERFDSLISYIENGGDTEGEGPRSSNEEKNALVLYYRVFRLEVQLASAVGAAECQKVLEVLRCVTECNMDALSMKYDLYNSLGRILARFTGGSVTRFLEVEENLISFLYHIDSLPIDLFGRVTAVLESLGENFISSVKELVSKGKLQLDEKNSRLMEYLLSVGFDPILL